MISIKREVATLKVDDSGVTLNCLSALTWTEWEELVRTVKKTYTPKGGYTLPGDTYDGRELGAKECYRPVIDFIHYPLKRKTVSGYTQVYTGPTELGDLIWWRAEDKFVPISPEDTKVDDAYCVLRLDWYTVEAGWVIKGDRIYDKPGSYTVAEAGNGRSITGTVKRRSVPGYEPVYEGTVKLGDLVWTCATHEYKPADIRDGERSVLHECYSVLRKVT